MMTLTEEFELSSPAVCRILDLPDDIIFKLFDYCDIQTLGRLASVCARLFQLVKRDCVWLKWKQLLTCIGNTCSNGWSCTLSCKDQCRVARNWKKKRYRDIRAIAHLNRLQPWMILDASDLWISYANVIRCYRHPTKISSSIKHKYLQEVASRQLTAGSSDVCRFAIKDDIVLVGSCDGSLSAFSAQSGKKISHYASCHVGDVSDVDIAGGGTVVSGSRDQNVKIWRLNRSRSEAHLHTVSAGDRVWSVAVNPDSRYLVVGTAGRNQTPPLRVWDLERLVQIGVLGSQYRHGASVMDVQFDSTNTLLTCGHDTVVRLWDLRKPLSKWQPNYLLEKSALSSSCLQPSIEPKFDVDVTDVGSVASWEEPFDSALYCVKSDGKNAFVVGTSRHGVVELFDKRHTKLVQFYFVGHSTSSPVYSVAFDSMQLFAGVDMGIHVLNFNCNER